jgi:hypothetical protein
MFYALDTTCFSPFSEQWRSHYPEREGLQWHGRYGTYLSQHTPLSSCLRRHEEIYAKHSRTSLEYSIYPEHVVAHPDDMTPGSLHAERVRQL